MFTVRYLVEYEERGRRRQMGFHDWDSALEYWAMLNDLGVRVFGAVVV